MKRTKFLILAIILSLNVVSTIALADLRTDRAVVKNDGSEEIVAVARFSDPVEGDLYIATQIDGELIFIVNEGIELSPTPVPFRANGIFTDDIVVLNASALGILPGRYPLFKVVTLPGTDPLDFRNWVGGLNGLSRINFSIGLPTNESLDHDDDGFPDDDLNRDGYHDDDLDLDGLHDDDSNRDGFHDDDSDRDGFHDDDSDRDGFHDDDLNHDGLRDDESHPDDDNDVS